MIINFLGDLILGDQPVKFGYGFDSNHSQKKYSGIFSGVSKILKEADYNVGNFEAIIKDRPPSTNVSNWSMCCDDSITAELSKEKINILNVANNHTMDYGQYWFDNTVKKIQQAEIRVVGLKHKPYVILEGEKEKAAIIGVSYLKTRHTELPYFFSPTESEWWKIISELETEGAKMIFLYIHWGSEFVEKPTQNQIEILNTLEKFNFTAIIGHHPHVLQTRCLYKEVPVFFSIGNLISDYWQERAKQTEILQCHFKGNILFKSTPCLISKDGLPVACNQQSSIVLKNFDGKINYIEDIFLERKQLRKEYAIEFLKNFHKIKNKPLFLKWAFTRLLYMFKHIRKEKLNPDIVYEKY